MSACIPRFCTCGHTYTLTHFCVHGWQNCGMKYSLAFGDITVTPNSIDYHSVPDAWYTAYCWWQCNFQMLESSVPKDTVAVHDWCNVTCAQNESGWYPSINYWNFTHACFAVGLVVLSPLLGRSETAPGHQRRLMLLAMMILDAITGIWMLLQYAYEVWG